MTGERYRPAFVVRWADLDSNAHMANTAYLDVCVDVRFGWFERCGIGAREIGKLKIGPVVKRDEVVYHRELHFLQKFTVDIALAGISDDASHFSFRNSFFRDDDKLAATVTSTGGWLDLTTRRLIVPPAAISEALLALPRTSDFEQLVSSIR